MGDAEENVEIVRRIYTEGLIYRDPERLVAELATPDIEYVAQGRGSESEAVQEEVHSWTLRDGRIVRFECGRDREKALEAAGLEG